MTCYFGLVVTGINETLGTMSQNLIFQRVKVKLRKSGQIQILRRLE